MPQQLDLFAFSAVVSPRGDGTYLLKPGKPVVPQPRITVRVAAGILGCSKHSVYRYLDEEIGRAHV